MMLIVGLGNPGKEYERTRHNAGARAVRTFHTLHIEELDGWSAKFSSEVSQGAASGAKVALMLPETFMNNSGDAVIQAVNFWKLAPKDLLIVCDDLDLPLGALRIRPEGGTGGHNGIKSIVERLGSNDIPRLRIGIGSNRLAQVPAEDYVLEKFSPDEEKVLADTLKKAAEAIEMILKKGMEPAMNKYNTAA
ncbi:MAG: aminoacyl-tRNA hydrolase [Patescibacteria group bacterium]